MSTYTKQDYISAQHLENLKGLQCPIDVFALLSCEDLAEQLDSLAARLFVKGHSNRILLEEAAVRLREY